MNPDQPSREQIEARITALLLGELPAEEAALLRYTIAQDPALKHLHDQLQSALPLVREAAQHPADAPAEKPAPLKMSADRREKLLAHFKTPRAEAPQEPLFWLKRIKVRALIEILAAVTIVAILAAMLVPSFSKAKMKAQRATALSEARQRELALQIAAGDKRDTMQNPPAAPQPTGAAPVANTAPNSQAEVTLGPETKIAPPPPAVVPPTQIILPQPESTPQVTALAGAPANTDTGGVYSQSIVGYVNVPVGGQGGQTLTVTPTANATPPVSTFSGGFGGAGGGGGLGGSNRNATLADTDKDRFLNTANSLSLAWDESRADRSRGNNQSFGLLSDSTANPKENLSGTESTKTEGQTSAGSIYYRNITRQPDKAENKKLPALATDVEHQRELKEYKANHKNSGFYTPQPDEYVTNAPLDIPNETQAPNNHFVSRYAFSEPSSPSPPQTPQTTNDLAVNSGENFTFNPGVSAITPAAGTSLDDLQKLYLNQSNQIQLAEGKVQTARRDLYITDSDSHATSPTPTINEQQLQTINQQMVEDKKIYDEQLVQLQELKSIARTNKEQVADALPQMVSDATLNSLLNKRHEARQNLVMLTNDYVVNSSAVARTQSSIDELNHQIDDRVDGIIDGLQSQVESKKASLNAMTASVDAAKNKEKEIAQNNQPYYAAKIDLEQKKKLHELLYSKLEAERLDMSLPNKSMVQITDPAEPGKSQNMWQRLTGQVESTARIKVENDVSDISSLSAAPSVASSGYDPYSVQTTFEIMQSELVLGKVVDALNLQSTWAKNNGGEKLGRAQAIEQLKMRLEIQRVKNTKLIAISAKSSDPLEAADIANAVAKAYAAYRIESRKTLTTNGLAMLEAQFDQHSKDISHAQGYVEKLHGELAMRQTNSQAEAAQSDLPLRKPAPNTPLPQPEILTSSNAFSTFSLNVSDVSFKLAEASLENGKLPDTASIRSEEFINAFNYRDPEAAPGQPMAFTSERAAYPFAHNRDLLRFSIKTAAAGRQEGRPLNLVLLLDTSGSMERADRVQIIHEALRVLTTQLHENDIVSVVSFARAARLWADGVSGGKAGETLDQVGSITPEGGTNLEEAMRLAYETAHRHYLANGMNRVVLLTDGAANLGNVDPGALKEKVEAQRKQGIALDCFGIGWEDLNDDLLEELSSNGDGRYAFLNSPEDAAKDFGTKLAGALQVAAQDVKVQVEFNPQRVISYRQIGYAKHQLTKQQFRDNTVAAGEIAAQEAGNALYTVETNPNGDGPIATVHVRYRIPGTQDYHEHSWDVAYTGNAPALDLSSPAMRLAATASAFSEWLAASAYAQEVTPEALAKYLTGVPEVYGADDRPKQLETMIREAKSLEGK